MTGPFVAVPEPQHGDRIGVHAAGCVDVRRTEERFDVRSWPLGAGTWQEAEREAGEEFSTDYPADPGADAKACAKALPPSEAIR